MEILIVDDHQLFLDGLRHILAKLNSNVVITESNCAEDAITILDSSQSFDLVLIDLNLPGMDGMSILQRMHERRSLNSIIVLSAEEHPNTIKAALEIGALGFIPKSHSSKEMLSALQAVLDGEIYVPEGIQKQIDNLTTTRPPKAAENNSQLKASGTTKRQYDVLLLLSKGYSNKQISASLFLTEHTVKTHISALFNALSAQNRTECVQLAQHQGIIPS
ncbi:DNA-binding response regulator [Solemya pervernicosa gill symbiont]|uniref:DNA-binding response regulator n=2 Tax=Gammaproteobacteria incertae sedis TaxID=118884 RepID=A0A1T2L2Y2_9GAMM|nr:response regulator transcription factor [Candidatus Reidiella endopervernicosa]OOZ39432.1 DNA-binding response regulator [Solemya pervernicosa gill symbiont]QKQ26722.1 response regulator transcription factor [Candidatus Reidiella endopervernicosa]